MTGVMTPDELKGRTKAFGVRVIRLATNLSHDPASRVIGNQILRSGTSVGANYRSACRARSRADFTDKMAIVEEEADETLYWLELLAESGLVKVEQLQPLMAEAGELVAIVAKSRMTARSGGRRP